MSLRALNAWAWYPKLTSKQTANHGPLNPTVSSPLPADATLGAVITCINLELYSQKVCVVDAITLLACCIEINKYPSTLSVYSQHP